MAARHSRILALNKHDFNGEAVMYVMSRDQRVHDNHALLAAQACALEQKVPLYVLFNLRHVKNRAREHYEFMIKGLKEVASELESLHIPFIMTSGDAEANVLHIAEETGAGALYFDFSPLAGNRKLAKQVADEFTGSVSVVDTHNVIPLWTASDKREFAAHTMRRKVHLALETYLVEPGKVAMHPYSASKQVTGMTFDEAEAFIAEIPAKGIMIAATPGEKAALQHLQKFIDTGLEHYALSRNDIANDQQSGFSPYLHHGQISSLRIALEVVSQTNVRPLLFDEVKLASADEVPSLVDGVNALLEEMIVRKELADNFCFYEPNYRKLRAAPEWAQKSLAVHASDPREFIYTREQWENAQTHDASWNAAQNQLRKSGKMHGYMRMYWAKKMLEWSETPEAALADCIYLNDTYSVDGSDPNGYVGMLWSIAGLHDRPWFERPVYGTIRYMNEGGLMRKFDVAAYQKQWNG